MPANAKMFIKPNIIFWTKATLFPKWGVITTSWVVEDMVMILKDHGISDITIGEGIVAAPMDTARSGVVTCWWLWRIFFLRIWSEPTCWDIR